MFGFELAVLLGLAAVVMLLIFSLFYEDGLLSFFALIVATAFMFVVCFENGAIDYNQQRYNLRGKKICELEHHYWNSDKLECYTTRPANTPIKVRIP